MEIMEEEEADDAQPERRDREKVGECVTQTDLLLLETWAGRH